jgi:hypothetical protein
MKSIILAVVLVSTASVATYVGFPSQNIDAPAGESNNKALSSIGGPIGVWSPPTPPPATGAFTVRQVPGQKFLVSGQVQPGQNWGILYSGAINGFDVSEATTGQHMGLFDVPAPGLVTARTCAYAGQFGPPTSFMLTNAPPKITALKVVALFKNFYRISGSVGDECPGGLVVTLKGPRGIMGGWLIVGQDGTFSSENYATVPRPFTISVTVTDWYGLADTATLVVP